jgi:hypothetical protein
MILVATSKELRIVRFNPEKTAVFQGFEDVQKVQPT